MLLVFIISDFFSAIKITSDASLVILGDERVNWRPHRYDSELLGCRVSLEFPVVKLLDYQDNLAALEQDSNPFALVVIAHLTAKATQGSMTTRKREKMRLTRLLLERGYPREEIIDLFRFLLWVLRLPPKLENEFRQELQQYQEERAMVYLSSYDELVIEESKQKWIEEGIAEGKQQGIAEGKQQGIAEGSQQGKRVLLQRILTRRFGELSPEILLKIQQLSETQVENLSEALFDLQEVADLSLWLSQN